MATKEGWIKRKLNGNGIPWNKGLTISDPRVAKNIQGHSEAMRGRKCSEETKIKISLKLKGRITSPETRRKIADSKRGEKSHFWQGGLTEMNKLIRHSVEYKLWREAVYRRDNYTCQECHQRGGKLNADHIKSFSQFPELRTSIQNGRTLCHSCHKKTATYGKNYQMNRKRNLLGQFT